MSGSLSSPLASFRSRRDECGRRSFAFSSHALPYWCWGSFGSRPSVPWITRHTFPNTVCIVSSWRPVRPFGSSDTCVRSGNFFFTLASVALASALLDPVLQVVPPLPVAISVSVLFEVALGVLDPNLEFLFHSARDTSLWAANREGLCSSLGYLSLYLVGVDIGRRLQRQRTRESWWHLVRGLAASSLVCFAIIVTRGSGYVSRRLANLYFVTWILAINTAIVAFLLAYDLVSVGPSENHDKPVLTAVARNQLVVFLVANLLTGFVNLTVQTLYASDFVAIVLLLSYLFVVIGTAYICDQLDLTLKYW